jgi:polysaccharide pyruvyl transferase CsaB
MKRIVISGYYGFGNTGDEAVLSGICATLKEVGVEAEITVISADPARTVREHPDTKAVGRKALACQLRAMMGADLFISGGGSLFQDATSARSPYYYLGILRLAQILRRKTMIYAQGIGPLLRPAIRSGVAGAFNRTDLITVRDEGSNALLREIGVTHEIHTCADPSFLVEADLEAADAIIDKAGLAGKSIIGVSLRPWPAADEWIAEAASAIPGVCDSLGATAAFIPLQESEDAPIGEGSVVLRHGGDPQVAKGLIARCDLVVGMRLHSLIFAAGAGVPCVPIVYDPKVSSFASEAGMDTMVKVGSEAGELADAMQLMWAQRQAAAEKLADKALDFRKRALRCGELTAELLA